MLDDKRCRAESTIDLTGSVCEGKVTRVRDPRASVVLCASLTIGMISSRPYANSLKLDFQSVSRNIIRTSLHPLR
jgi:hypothetical protein